MCVWVLGCHGFDARGRLVQSEIGDSYETILGLKVLKTRYSYSLDVCLHVRTFTFHLPLTPAHYIPPPGFSEILLLLLFLLTGDDFYSTCDFFCSTTNTHLATWSHPTHPRLT